MDNQVVAFGIEQANQSYFAAIERAQLAPITKRVYRQALMRFFATGASLTPEALADYAAAHNNTSLSQLHAALAHMVRDAKNNAKGRATPYNIDLVQAVMYRIEAIQDAFTVQPTKGEKVFNWLTPAEVQRIMHATPAGPVGDRDRCALGILFGAGLRREELANLTFQMVKTKSTKSGDTRYLLEILGKGAKYRRIPISKSLSELIFAWGKHVGNTGNVIRSIHKGGAIEEKMSAQGLYNLVRRYGAMIGKPELETHDCRRTFAQIAYDAKIPLEQIQFSMGHATLDATKKYLDIRLNIDMTPSDCIPLD